MKTILVVDDNPAMLDLTRQRLESASAYVVFTEARGSHAVETARHCKPDLILLDILMPGMLGSEVAAALHEDPALTHIKVVYMTSMLKAGDEQKSGNETVIGKPVHTADLLAIVALELA
ncbi:MAG: response regulator [Sulfuritalea sp.]|nr:response regulator [Sulfuritalea sp.]